MGEVWRGLHEDQGVYVAVKVLTGDRAQEPRYLEAFNNEVRAMATLDHPGIVRLFDFGQVPLAADPALGLRPGSPYLVMELVEGGSLARQRQGLVWPELQGVLHSLLGALAHAHARGQIHRDLKPENLLTGLGGHAAGVKISDFGLAHAMDFDRGDDTGPLLIQGTPAYMAPEQFLASWRDYGPWTDLYALGCVAWALATGLPPFGRRGDLREFRRAHAKQPPPDFRPRHPVPAGYEPWLRRLLAKRPPHRFQLAADARQALEALGDPIPLAGTHADPDQASPAPAAEDISQTATIMETGTLEWVTVAGAEESLRTPLAVPTPPQNWRSDRGAARPQALEGVGLGLFGLRELPVVGREPEQDHLWRVLCGVHSSGRSQAVVLHGPAGCGRSHLARWLVQRAHEAGAARILRAEHNPDGGLGHGLQSMLARFFKTRGLGRLEALDRVREALQAQGVRDEAEAYALTELVRPASSWGRDAGSRRVQFGSQQERHILVERLLLRLCRERPVLLWLEDAHWAPSTLALARSLLTRHQDQGLLLLITASEGALAERPASAEIIAGLLERGGAVSIPVGPLDRTARRELIRGQLGLDGELADRVQDRTAGNPLFAIQLVQDWIHRGVLEPGPRGFRLRPGQDPALPPDLVAVWAHRLDELLQHHPRGHRRALEVAAVLGMDVSDQEWAAACNQAGLEPARELVETLCALRLGARHPSDGSWSFVHAMLRESLLQRASAGDRLVLHHRACAEMLRSGPARPSPERLGRHLVAAGDWQGALAPLLQGIRDHLGAGDAASGGRLLRLWDRAIDQLRLPDDDTRLGAGWLERARHARLAKDLAAARIHADRVEGAARAHGWQRLLAEALREQARLARLRGDPGRAWDLVVAASTQAGQTTDRRLQSDCGWELAHLLVDRGEFDRADRVFHRSLIGYQALKDGTGRGHCETGLAVIARQRGQVEPARVLLERASRHYEWAGSRWGVAETFIHRGDVDRLAGDLDLARAHYQEARERYQALGVDDHALLDQREALLYLERGQPDLARPLLVACLQTFQGQQRSVLAACTHVFLLCSVCHDQDWHGWSHHLGRARQLLAVTRHVEVDLARTARTAGHLARRLGQIDHARAAYALSLGQWQALGLVAEVAALEASLKALT